MKCEICKKKIEELFLTKFKGTYVKIKGKKKIVCSECQKTHGKELKNKLA